MSGVATRSTVTTSTRSLRRLRLVRALPRHLLYATCAMGLLASARFAIAPPRPSASAARQRLAPQLDLAAQGYATRFARRYLTWDANEPQGDSRPLGPLAGSGTELDSGLRLPPTGEQHVAWVEVVQAREQKAGEHVYTVAAETDTAGLVYLTVDVLRRSDGALALGGYPAFVGGPSSAPAQEPARRHELKDPALGEVVERALHNYLSVSAQDLAADLAEGAQVSLPSIRLAPIAVSRMSWTSDNRSVLALVQAQDQRGVSYTLEYELDVVARQGRWEITAIQTDPNA